MPNMNEFAYLLGEKTTLKALCEGVVKHLSAMPIDVQKKLADQMKSTMKVEQKRLNKSNQPKNTIKGKEKKLRVFRISARSCRACRLIDMAGVSYKACAGFAAAVTVPSTRSTGQRADIEDRFCWSYCWIAITALATSHRTASSFDS